ncbi:MAG: dihydrofolate reductase [Sphingomonadales bacterium]|jgi:dihydrofolate reductase|uniref:dihydrofolate reductase n=1 Tax=Sphingorhabdus sp. TaxID=1902408 RepID=UPI001B65A82D|nr:dihydrofolate reductase [Sphingorhabdus sp.]MCE2829147.1 dihydrofolate reductase [Sphingomonadales bacterium]
MDHPVIIMVAARADNGVIGVDGDLPWRIPADLRHFKQITKGRPMIMGRKTFDSLPGLLEGRRHIVLTRDADWEEEGAEVAHSVDEALKLANGPHVCVIGGAEIYRLFLPHADRIELTEVKANPAGDTVLEPFDMSVWRELMRVANPAENGQPAFDFVTLVRKEG